VLLNAVRDLVSMETFRYLHSFMLSGFVNNKINNQTKSFKFYRLFKYDILLL